MDAIEIILYVVVMIVWVIIQNARKKKVKAQQEAQREAQERASEGNYEQMDRELDYETESRSPKDRSLIDEIIKEIRNEDPVEVTEPEIEKEYNPSPVKDYSQIETTSTRDYEKQLAELKSQKRGQDSTRFDQSIIELKEDDEEDEYDNDYTSLIFEDEDSPRKAVILSEILNRKHF